MRNLLLASVAVLALGAATPALAQSATTAVGTAAGATTGGTIGFFLGGPIGAVIGGFTGAAIGAGVSQSAIDYAARNPVDPIYLDGDIDVGYDVGSDVTIYPIEGDDSYGYFYANNRVYIVNQNDRRVVQSPGYVIPQSTVSYVQDNPQADIEFSGELAPGARFSGNVDMYEVPNNPDYSYVYVGGRPVLVDNRRGIVVWVG